VPSPRHLAPSEERGWRGQVSRETANALTTPLRGACDKLTRRANHLYESRHPVPEEGALAIVTERWDGMRWTPRYRA
jgi:hypothetical protein